MVFGDTHHFISHYLLFQLKLHFIRFCRFSITSNSKLWYFKQDELTDVSIRENPLSSLHSQDQWGTDSRVGCNDSRYVLPLQPKHIKSQPGVCTHAPKMDAIGNMLCSYHFLLFFCSWMDKKRINTNIIILHHTDSQWIGFTPRRETVMCTVQI